MTPESVPNAGPADPPVTAATVSVIASELARITANALVFMPSRSTLKTALVEAVNGELHITATDGYTAGADYCATTTAEPVEWGVELHFDDLTLLRRLGQEGKKNAVGLSYDGSVLTAECDGATPFKAVDSAALSTATGAERFAIVENLLDSCQVKEPANPCRIMLDPALLGRFGKVRADKSERRADFLIWDNERPVFVRIGPTFRGLVMPVDGAVNAAACGDQDGLWA